MSIQIKRIYDPVEPTDGKRILVDRLWPRGIPKDKAVLAEWMKEVAPSPELRKWFNHKPELFAEFRERYLQELTEDPAHHQAVEHIRELAEVDTVTLVYSAKDLQHNNCVVLCEYISNNLSKKE